MQREAKTTQAQTFAEFRRTERNKRKDEAKKITKLSPVPSEPSPGQHHCWLYHKTRDPARRQILWKDGYSSQVLSLHQITMFPRYFYFFFFFMTALQLSLLHSSTTSISVYAPNFWKPLLNSLEGKPWADEAALSYPLLHWRSSTPSPKTAIFPPKYPNVVQIHSYICNQHF